MEEVLFVECICEGEDKESLEGGRGRRKEEEEGKAGMLLSLTESTRSP